MCESVGPAGPKWGVVGAAVLPNIGGWIGGFITRKNISPWYQSLKRPEWRPPNWAFAPIWTGLYTSIGTASYLVYRDGGGFQGPAKLPLILYGSNLALNWAWTPIFFGKHNLKWAFYEIQLVNITALGTGILFFKINKSAGYLFIPYILWLGLATALNYKIYKDNTPEEETKEPKVKEVN